MLAEWRFGDCDGGRLQAHLPLRAAAAPPLGPRGPPKEGLGPHLLPGVPGLGLCRCRAQLVGTLRLPPHRQRAAPQEHAYSVPAEESSGEGAASECCDMMGGVQNELSHIAIYVLWLQQQKKKKKETYMYFDIPP